MANSAEKNRDVGKARIRWGGIATPIIYIIHRPILRVATYFSIVVIQQAKYSVSR